MKITIEATGHELNYLQECLINEAGMSCSNAEGMAIILTELIDNSFELPGYNLKIVKVKET